MKILSNDLDKSRNTKAAVFSFSIYPGKYHSRKCVLCGLLQVPGDHNSFTYVFITHLNHPLGNLIEKQKFLYSKRILLS